MATNFFKIKNSEIGFIDELLAFTRLHKKTITSNSQFLVNLESAILLKNFLEKFQNTGVQQLRKMQLLNMIQKL